MKIVLAAPASTCAASIVSNVLLDVSETLKGAPAAQFRMAVKGGAVGDLTLRVSDLPTVQQRHQVRGARGQGAR